MQSSYEVESENGVLGESVPTPLAFSLTSTQIRWR